jgi:hypothetical protein
MSDHQPESAVSGSGMSTDADADEESAVSGSGQPR